MGLHDTIAAPDSLSGASTPPWPRMTPTSSNNVRVNNPGRIIDQFVHWKVLRHMRRQAGKDRLTNGVFQSSRSRLRRVVALLVWLEERGRSIETATQSDLEEYLVTQPKSVIGELGQFLIWTRQTGLNHTLTSTYQSSSEPQVTMSDDDRWDHVNTLLHDESIRLHTRIAGLLMLLFAQPITTICAMRTEQVDTSSGDRVLVTFEATPIEMPDPLAVLIRTHIRATRASLLRQPRQRMALPRRHPRATPGHRDDPSPTRRPRNPAALGQARRTLRALRTSPTHDPGPEPRDLADRRNQIGRSRCPRLGPIRQPTGRINPAPNIADPPTAQIRPYKMCGLTALSGRPNLVLPTGDSVAPRMAASQRRWWSAVTLNRGLETRLQSRTSG